MAKKSVRNAAPAGKSEPAPKPKPFEIDIAPSQDAGEGLTLRTSASDLLVTDRESHELSLEMMRGAKQLKRKIEEHWSRITRSVDDLKRNLLNLKRQDVEPVEAAIAMLSSKALVYENAEKERARREQDEIDRKAREDAERDREANARRQEADALKLEAASEDLSARELWFVTQIVEHEISLEGSALEHGKKLVGFAKAGGYKDPETQARKLFESPKIRKAVESMRQARTIREQVAAQREQPLEVATQQVESKLGKVSGVSTRTYYSAEVFDVDALIDGVIAGTVDRGALLPNQTFLNDAATRIKEAKLFDPAFPGVRLKKRQGHAG